MKMNWFVLGITILVSTLIILIGSVAGFFIPNLNMPSDNLLAEVALPVILAMFFSTITRFIASQQTQNLRSGALGGALNALINLGPFLLVISLGDKHFIAIGGRSLVVWLPFVPLVGALFGIIGAVSRKLLRIPAKDKFDKESIQ